MYHYKLFERDGSDIGEAEYAVLIEAGETIRTGDGRLLRVVDIVPTLGDNERFVGFLMVEPA